MSDQLKDKVIEVACRNLRATGSTYIVVKPDGEQLVEGALKLASDGVHRRAERKYHFTQTGYVDIIKAMEVGDTYRFEVEGDYPVESYRKAIAGTAASRWGKGAHKSTTGPTYVDLIRLA